MNIVYVNEAVKISWYSGEKAPGEGETAQRSQNGLKAFIKFSFTSITTDPIQGSHIVSYTYDTDK